MKQAWYRHRRVDGRMAGQTAILALGLLVISLTVTSCGKPKQVSTPSKEPGAYTDQGGVSLTTRPAQSLPGRAVQKAAGERCMGNLRQLRMMIDMYQSDNGAYPESLSAVPDAARLSKCAISRQDYVYDPASGRVSCTFPGHEKF